MKNKSFLFSLVFIFLVLFQAGFSVSVSDFEYKTTLQVSCDEYKGYVKAELPESFSNLQNPKSFMDRDYVIEKNKVSPFFLNQPNWYVKQMEDILVSDVEFSFDNNFQTVTLIENRNELSFNLENPSKKIINKLSFDTKDSQIKTITVYDKKGKNLPFYLQKNNFHYDVILDSLISTDFLQIDLTFEDVLKIKEINVYSLQKSEEKNFIYFYVNNDCDVKHFFYYGNFGKSTLRYGSKPLPVFFDVISFTEKNPKYDGDFDNDTILNLNDNCPYVSNVDQKDIDYNLQGDACQDDDRDSIVNSKDNCPNTYNRNQADGDKDSVGDVCDAEDSRVLEQNPYIVYVLAGLISIIFIGFSFVLFKKNNY